MQIGKYLKEHQPVIYQTFVNSIQNETLSHAYLLVGNPGTPLLETAKYLAKTILCDEPSPLACDNCITCLRIDSENYPDIVMLDGEKGTIKKEDVLAIEEKFDKTAFESKGIMIYIINLVENMTVEAVNSMLKFLEEPGAEIYAFLTTNNENNVLPTIISRCQTLYLKSRPREDVINEALEFNVEREDAELLSFFYNDGERIYELLNNKDENEVYQDMKKAVVKFINALNEDEKGSAIYIMEHDIFSVVKSKEDLRYFLDMLSQFFEDLLNIQSNRSIILTSYATILNSLATKLRHVSSSLVEILKQRTIINLNVNSSLLLDHLTNFIVKE